MKKINLKEFDVFTDISKRQRVRCDMRRSVANLLYNQMHGIEALNLALTIHRSEGELSVSDDDLRMLQTAVERFAMRSRSTSKNTTGTLKRNRIWQSRMKRRVFSRRRF